VTDLSPFGCAEWVPSPSIVYGSQSLPMIPDGRISRVRFEAAAREFSLHGGRPATVLA